MKNIATVVVGLLLLGAVMVMWSQFEVWQRNNVGGVACTADAKMCPDGSYVGRTGPNCEFTACPTSGVRIIDPSVSGIVNSFESCVSMGYPVMESYPRQCRTPDGQTFVELLEQ